MGRTATDNVDELQAYIARNAPSFAAPPPPRATVVGVVAPPLDPARREALRRVFECVVFRPSGGARGREGRRRRPRGAAIVVAREVPLRSSGGKCGEW